MSWESYFGDGDAVRDGFEREWARKSRRRPYSYFRETCEGWAEREKEEAYREYRNMHYEGRQVTIYDDCEGEKTYVIDRWGKAVPKDEYESED